MSAPRGPKPMSETKTITVRLPLSVHAELSRRAAENYEPLTALIRRICIAESRRDASKGER